MNPNTDETSNPAPPATEAASSAAPATPATPTSPPPRRSLFRSAVGIPIVLLALIGVVFGITYIAQNTRRPKPPSELPEDAEPPLRFFTSTRIWNPFGSLQDRQFPMFYEPGEQLHPATFWFENRNQQVVLMQLNTKTGLSCSACSASRLAPIPPAVTRQLLEMQAISVLPQGLFSGLPLGMVGPAGNLAPNRLEWQEFVHRSVELATYRVPAADNSDGWSPQWGILELLFQVREGPPAPLNAKFTTQLEGSTEFRTNEFGIAFEGCPPFEVYPGKISLGEMTDRTESRTYDVIVYSRTRGSKRTGPGDNGDLGTPKAVVDMPPGVTGDPGSFVSLSDPIRVPDDELWKLTQELVRMMNEQTGKPAYIRLESAYRMKVTVDPRAADSRIDLGPFDRHVNLSVPGLNAKQKLEVSGTVLGRLKLDNNRTDIIIPAFRPADGYTVELKLICEDRDAVVTEVKDLCLPQYMDVKVKKLQGEGTRSLHSLRLTIPKGSPGGAWNGLVVLEVKVGATTQRLRIPVKKT